MKILTTEKINIKLFDLIIYNIKANSAGIFDQASKWRQNFDVEKALKNERKFRRWNIDFDLDGDFHVKISKPNRKC